MSITIKKLLDVDEDFFINQSNITLEATVKQVGQAYERKVKEGKRKGQPFWSQKLTINDGTGAIVVDFIANKAEQTIPKTAVGKRIKIEDAKTDIYKDERRLARGKVTLLNGQHITPKETAVLANGYYVVVGPNGKVVKAPEVDEREQRLIAGQAVAKSLIEAGRKWGKAVEKEADGWLGWIYNSKPKDEPKPEKKPEEKSTKKEEFDEIMDEKFDRDRIKTEIAQLWGRAFKAKQVRGDISKWISENFEGKHSLLTFDDSEMIEARNKLKELIEEEE